MSKVDYQARNREQLRQWGINLKKEMREKYADLDDLAFEVYFELACNRVWLNQQYREAGLGEGVVNE
jgi:hypothetical protein